MNLGYKKIGFYGLEFKPNTGDLRNSPIIDIIKLVSRKLDVFVYDKFIDGNFSIDKVKIVKNIDILEKETDVIITYHKDKNSNFIFWDQIKI